jgi:hypothetical protein
MNRNISKLLIISVICALAAALSACGWAGEPADASDLAYKDDMITVTGLTDEDFTITPADLAKLDCVDREVKTKNSWGNEETDRATGPLLTIFIESKGRKAEDFQGIKIIASDGYFADLTQSDLKEKRYVLSFRRGDKPLTTENIPLRLLTPDEESSYWVSGVVKMEFSAS